jgi:Putative exonuclease SbcCD, C subunit
LPGWNWSPLAQQIHERTVDAKDLISRMNTEMRSRKMSLGKTVGVRWLLADQQSVSLHLPLFAAAYAMLNSAHPHAPRLLALDEAFAGVDDTGRSELMGLAAQFDLDLFMTGYDLWATQASVRAAAHYDLAHSPAEHTVSALLPVWDGAQLLADEVGELSAVLGSPGTRRAIAAVA